MALSRFIKNESNIPHLENEGIFIKPIDIERKKAWDEGLEPYERMYIHHTLTSVRRNANFKPFPGLIPTNSLDLSLSSNYNHAVEYFPDPVDTILQPETVGFTTWRRLRNTKDVLPGEDPRIASLRKEQLREYDVTPHFERNVKSKKKYDVKYFKSHPVVIGGIKDRVHPSYVKLMNSSHHAPQTNAGYSRQSGDGNIFVY